MAGLGGGVGGAEDGGGKSEGNTPEAEERGPESRIKTCFLDNLN